MRVLEGGLKAIGADLGIERASGWESYLKQFRAMLDKDWADRPPALKSKEAFYRETSAHLHAVKMAWRNPTMHIDRNYSESSAEDTLNATKDLIAHIALNLSELPPDEL